MYFFFLFCDSESGAKCERADHKDLPFLCVVHTYKLKNECEVFGSSFFARFSRTMHGDVENFLWFRFYSCNIYDMTLLLKSKATQ